MASVAPEAISASPSTKLRAGTSAAPESVTTPSAMPHPATEVRRNETSSTAAPLSAFSLNWTSNATP